VATFSPEQLAEALQKAPSAFLSQFDPAMRRYLRGFAQGTMAKRITGRPGLINRTGALRRSFGTAVTGEGSVDTWAGTVYTTSPYARMQEFGGTQTPKKSQFLTIPLASARTGAGASRGGARSFSNTFFAKSKAGNLLMFQKQGKKIVPLFVLKKSVSIPPRLGMRSAWEQDVDARRAVLAKATKAALDGLGA